MTGRIHACITVCGFLFLMAVAVSAQESGGGLVVRSMPEGAQATLSGDVVVTGITPTLFRQPLIGRYKLEVSLHGYEKYTSRVMLDPSRQMEVAVNLSPKTRFKAAARSLFIPGWGQRYADEKTKGLVFTALAAGSLAAFLIADGDFDEKYDRYESRVEAFDSAKADGASYQDLSRLHQALVEAQDKAYDAENVRRVTVGAVVGVWSLNLLDVILFFPSERGTISVKGLTISPETDLQSFGVTLSRRF